MKHKKELDLRIRVIEVVNEIAHCFPELDNAAIVVSFALTRFTMLAGCIPPWKGMRRYLLLIGYGKYNILNAGILTKKQLRGVVAHELCHFVQYSKMTTLGYWLFVLKYKLSMSFRREVERSTDLETIHRGFGHELLAFSLKADNRPGLPGQKYSKYRQDIYLSSFEIAAEIDVYEVAIKLNDQY